MLRRILAVVLSLALFALGACKGTPSRQRASGTPNPAFIGEVAQDAGVADCAPGRYGGTLVMATPYNPETFNIITSQSDSTSTIVDHIVFNSITGYDNYTQKIVPELARSWEASMDGLTWTIYLRKGVLWSDGIPFNADDVMFSYKVMSDPEIASSERDSFLQPDGSAPSIEKVDDFTVRFHLTSPFDFSAALNDLHPVPKHKWESVYKAGDFRHAMSISGDLKDVIGTGPYRPVSFAADQQITLERNPYYWRVDKDGHRLPWIDKVTFLVVPNNNTWNLKMENGDLDIYQKIQEGADELKRFEKKGDFKVYPLGSSFTVNYVAFNQDT
ncbi:MAG: ABC transporter substrate-binding protein, partial [Blastocatellia bacterium]